MPPFGEVNSPLQHQVLRSNRCGDSIPLAVTKAGPFASIRLRLGNIVDGNHGP